MLKIIIKRGDPEISRHFYLGVEVPLNEKPHTVSGFLSAITSQYLDSSETHLNTCCLGDSVF